MRRKRWAESKVVEQNNERYYLQFRKRETDLFYIPYRGERAERLLVHFFFLFYDFKYNIEP